MADTVAFTSSAVFLSFCTCRHTLQTESILIHGLQNVKKEVQQHEEEGQEMTFIICLRIILWACAFDP